MPCHLSACASASSPFIYSSEVKSVPLPFFCRLALVVYFCFRFFSPLSRFAFLFSVLFHRSPEPIVWHASNVCSAMTRVSHGPMPSILSSHASLHSAHLSAHLSLSLSLRAPAVQSPLSKINTDRKSVDELCVMLNMRHQSIMRAVKADGRFVVVMK